MMAKCPICQLPYGFHDHKDVTIPPDKLLAKGWLADLLSREKGKK